MIKVSPSGTSYLLECPRCLWLQMNENKKRPRGAYPSLPDGMDNVFKKYFDEYRKRGELPPEIEGKVEGQLYNDNLAEFNKWREVDFGRGGLGAKFPDLDIVLRGAIDDLLIEREKNRPKETGRLLLNDTPYPVKNITYLGNCLNSKTEAFYLRHNAKVTELAAENGMDLSDRRVMISKYCVKNELGLCGTDTGNLYLVDEEKRKYPLKFNCEGSVMEVYFPGKAPERE